MSLAHDITVALEAIVRAAIPAIPAGALGVSYVMRLPQDLNLEATPHLVFGAEEERSVLLRFRQERVTAALGLAVIYRGAVHADLLADYGAVRTGWDQDHTLGGVIETGTLELVGIHETSDDRSQVLEMRIAGTRVFS